MRRAAFTTLCSPGELARLGVVHEEHVDAPERLEQALAASTAIQKFIVSQATKRGAAHLVEHGALEVRVDVARGRRTRSRGSAAGSSGRNSAKTLSCVSSVWAVLRSNS